MEIADAGRTTSESEEMYLIHTAMAGEDGVEGPVPLSLLAGALGVSPVSANQMVRKLDQRGLVDYAPYKGITLTEHGRRIARRVLRRRRLWGVFLAERLGLSPEAADDAACEFEHVTTPQVETRLAAYLGDPSTGPTGRPIPGPDGSLPDGPTGIPLAGARVGGRHRIVRLECDPRTGGFLAAEGVTPGALVRLQAVGAGGACLVDCGNGLVHLAGPVAACVFVGTEGSR